MPVEKHLEMIQAVVNRLAGNSYAYKGWAITVATALVAFLYQKYPGLVWAALYPVAAFWFLDSHTLALERAFRRLYDRAVEGDVAEYCMTPGESRRPLRDQIDAMLSGTILVFYGSTMAFIIVIAGVLKK